MRIVRAKQKVITYTQMLVRELIKYHKSKGTETETCNINNIN